jgi:hypothetical protein
MTSARGANNLRTKRFADTSHLLLFAPLPCGAFFLGISSHSWRYGHPVARGGILDTGEAHHPWSRWLRSRDVQSTEDQAESRAGLAVPQVEHGNEVDGAGGGWLGWDAWVSTSLSDRSDGH